MPDLLLTMEEQSHSSKGMAAGSEYAMKHRICEAHLILSFREIHTTSTNDNDIQPIYQTEEMRPRSFKVTMLGHTLVHTNSTGGGKNMLRLQYITADRGMFPS